MCTSAYGNAFIVYSFESFGKVPLSDSKQSPWALSFIDT